jgi:hypothetical protein
MPAFDELIECLEVAGRRSFLLVFHRHKAVSHVNFLIELEESVQSVLTTKYIGYSLLLATAGVTRPTSTYFSFALTSTTAPADSP